MRRQHGIRGAASVLVVGVEPRGMGLIRECLGAEAVLPTHVTPYQEAAPIVQKSRPNVVIVGFDADPEQAVRLGPELLAESKSVHLVAMSEQTDPERIRAAMRAGYREYVVLPDDADLLRKAVHEGAYGSDEEEPQGEVIALVGSKGGVGVTMLAVHLAAELSPVNRVCVVDMDFSMGDVAAFLDLQPTRSIYDLLHEAHRLDRRMLAGSVLVHPSKVHVLPQPTELMDLEEIRGDDILRILNAAADAYQYVLVDCGGRIDETTLTTTTVADRVFLVCSPSVVAVKNAWRRLQLMERVGIEKDAIRLVVNRWTRDSELSIKDIETHLDIPVAATIAHDPASCDKAVDMGRLLRDVNRRSPALRDIGAAVDLITTGAERIETETDGRKPFWSLFR